MTGEYDQRAADSMGGEEGEIHELAKYQLKQIKARKLAQEWIAEEEAEHHPLPEGVALTDFLAQEDDTPQQIIKGLWNSGTPVLLAAQYKAGKTTLRDNAVKSLADGYAFLDTFRVNKVTNGTIAVIDLELSPNMMRNWYRDQHIKNTDLVVVFPMRGQGAALNLMVPNVRQEWVKKLKAISCEVLILDCLRPVLDALGLSEDKDAGRFLNAGFDSLMVDAEIDNGMVIHHMGHNGERARGDSSMLGWGDSWRINRKDPDDPGSERYFTAYGRDIDVPEGLLEHTGVNRHLSYKQGSRKDSQAITDLEAILSWIKANQPVKSENVVIKAFNRTQDERPNIPDRRVKSALIYARKTLQIDGGAVSQGVSQPIVVRDLGMSF